MRISVRGSVPCELAPVRAATRAAVRPFGLPADAALTIAFVGDIVMRDLNRRHRGKDRTTDVLSFGQDLPAGVKGAAAVAHFPRDLDGRLEVGDIVISGTQAARQAARRGHPLVREVAFLAAHGALHLLGHEDETSAGYREMVGLGTAAIASAGLVPVGEANQNGLPRVRRP